MTSHLLGFLNIDKPRGRTSRDVVNAIQRLVRPAKVGHAGTLDPRATGVLVVCVGPATRLVSLVQQGRKRYRAEFQFGVTSETDDTEGELHDLPDASPVTVEAIAAALPAFRGTIEQVPPLHSAIQVGGQRAYKLARRGEKPNLTARPVEIHRFDIDHFDESAQRLTSTIECGSGTYIRSLGRDLAARLGTGAVMMSLRRLAVGPFTIEEALPLSEINQQTLPEHLQPALLAFLDEQTHLNLTPDEWDDIRHGRLLRREGFSPPADQPIPLLYQGQLAGVGRFVPSKNRLHGTIVFPIDPPLV